MTLDQFGRYIHHHQEERADEIHLVKDVTMFTLHSTDEYFLKYNNTKPFLRLFHTGCMRRLILEGYTKNLVFFLNGKAFADEAGLLVESISPI